MANSPRRVVRTKLNKRALRNLVDKDSGVPLRYCLSIVGVTHPAHLTHQCLDSVDYVYASGEGAGVTDAVEVIDYFL